MDSANRSNDVNDSAKTAKLVSSFRFLHIEPSVELSLNLRAELRRAGFQFTMERVGTVDAAEQAIQNERWDLIISEYMIPMLTVEMVLTWLRKRKMETPLLVYSTNDSDRALVDAMRAGARDYLIKGRLPDLMEALERELQEVHARRAGKGEHTMATVTSAAPLPRILAPVTGGQVIDPDLCGSETVLLVDDDPTFREFMLWTLRRHGYHVIQATDGEEANYILEHYLDRIHAMICDVIMPNMDGLELAARISRSKPDVRVIMVSGYNDNPLERGHRIAGRYPLVWKPFDVAKVLRLMRELLCEETSAAEIPG